MHNRNFSKIISTNLKNQIKSSDYGFQIHKNIHSHCKIHRPSGLRLGWSSEIVSSIVPYTSQILSARGKSFEDIAVSYCHAQRPANIVGTVGTRRVEDSWLELILPFPDHVSLRETMVDADGYTVRYGKLFEILDALAADVAYRHACDPINFEEESRNKTIVTACVDGMRNFKSININQVLKLQSYVSYVGRTSMEICIDIIKLNGENDIEEVCGTVQFIMVARETMKTPGQSVGAVAVHQIEKMDHEEVDSNSVDRGDPMSVMVKERAMAGKERAAIRKGKSAISLDTTPPKAEEVEIIHQLYLASKELKSQKNMYLMNLIASSNEEQGRQHFRNSISEVLQNKVMKTETDTDQNVKYLLSKLQSGNIKWMSHTIFKNILLMHPQSRNVHCNIFGGYIMRVAYEMSQVTAMCFYGDNCIVKYASDDSDSVSHSRHSYASKMYPSATPANMTTDIPTFVACDDIKFLKPVAIGSIMEFASTVIYSRDYKIVVQVKAHDINKSTRKRTLTNMFTFVFEAPAKVVEKDSNAEVGAYDKVQGHTVQVMPREYDEFVSYIEGKRCLDVLVKED